MLKLEMVVLRKFLEGLAGGNFASAKIPAVMYQLARRAVGPQEPQDLVEDVLGELLLKLISAGRRGSPGSPVALLALDDHRLAPVLVHRLRQAMVALFPRWRQVVKPLRAHVRRALNAGVEPGGLMPTTLVSKNGNLSAARVTEAVAAVLAGTDAPPRSVEAITAVLVESFFGVHGLIQHDPRADEPTAEDVAADLHDAPILAGDVERLLGRHLAAVVGDRAAGATLEDIGAGLGVGTSTAHAHVHEGIHRLRRARGRWSSPGTTMRALKLLAARGRE